jgi:hypothetical protein
MNIVVGFQYEHRRCGQVLGGEFFDVDPAANARSAVASGTALATGRTITDQRAIVQTERHVVGIDAAPVRESAATRSAGAAQGVVTDQDADGDRGRQGIESLGGLKPALMMPPVNTL